MTMNKQAMQNTHKNGKLVWAMPLVLGCFAACAGPVREGEVDWKEFQEIVDVGQSEVEAIDREIAAFQDELSKLSDREREIESFVGDGVSAGSGDVAKRWNRMKEVKTSLEELRLRRSVIQTDEKGLELSREVTITDMHADAASFLVDAWQGTREGARNLHFNYGVGAKTDSTVSITGLIATLDPNVSIPFSGELGGKSMKTDSSDLGVEYYFKDDWALELGAIFSNAVREDEFVDYGTLSYDEEKHIGTFVGLKHCIGVINAGGGGGLNGRARLFLNARLGLMEEYDVSGEVSFGGGLPPVDLSTTGDAYFTLSLGAGALYAWTDHISFEVGFNVVNSISDIDGQWSFSGPDGAGGTYSGDYTTDLAMTRAYFGVLFGF
jgi:hypothetical protein